jgi:hypothetical protein
VDALVEELLGLVEQGTGEDNDTGRAVTDLVVLGLGELDEEASGLVLDFHLLDNGGSVVGDNNITVGANYI